MSGIESLSKGGSEVGREGRLGRVIVSVTVLRSILEIGGRFFGGG